MDRGLSFMKIVIITLFFFSQALLAGAKLVVSSPVIVVQANTTRTVVLDSGRADVEAKTVCSLVHDKSPYDRSLNEGVQLEIISSMQMQARKITWDELKQVTIARLGASHESLEKINTPEQLQQAITDLGGKNKISVTEMMNADVQSHILKLRTTGGTLLDILCISNKKLNLYDVLNLMYQGSKSVANPAYSQMEPIREIN